MGNSKLGRSGLIWAFGLPSRATCPGRSEVCSRVCYSHRLERFRPNVRALYERNLELSRWPDFASNMIREIGANHVRVLRVHVAGDFYSADYATKWLGVMRAMPMVTFFAYTRSWRVPGFADVFRDMAGLQNVRLWYSCDRETGVPDEVPEGVRLAWLMADGGDLPPRADLVFRVARLRRHPTKSLRCAAGADAPVCPVENGITGGRTDCSRCGTCWEALTGRLPLPILAPS